MAKQGYSKTLDLRLIAVDPGEAWTGVAFLNLHRRRWSAWTGVIHSEPRTVGETVDEILRYDPLGIIVENYQNRGVGHQTWATPRTPRIIGGLEYAAHQSGRHVHLVAPGNEQLIKQYPIYPYLQLMRQKWTYPNVTEWGHALSAWRVLMAWMMLKMPERMTALYAASQAPAITWHSADWLSLDPPITISEHDLSSLPAHWTTK